MDLYHLFELCLCKNSFGKIYRGETGSHAAGTKFQQGFNIGGFDLDFRRNPAHPDEFPDKAARNISFRTDKERTVSKE